MKTIALAIALLAMPANAQQPPQPTAEVQALQNRIMQEINAAIQCTTQAIALGQENSKLKAEIEALKLAGPPAKK